MAGYNRRRCAGVGAHDCSAVVSKRRPEKRLPEQVVTDFSVQVRSGGNLTRHVELCLRARGVSVLNEGLRLRVSRCVKQRGQDLSRKWEAG